MKNRSENNWASAPAPGAGDGVTPSRTFLERLQNSTRATVDGSLFRRDAETNTRDACATQHSTRQVSFALTFVRHPSFVLRHYHGIAA